MTYEPPKNIWEVDNQLQFNEALSDTDERYVQTEGGRGHHNFNALMKTLGIDPSTLSLRVASDKKYVLFCGHRGCGKSTELRRISKRLNKADAFFVVSLDATSEVDINNASYPDILMALAKGLLERLRVEEIVIEPVFLRNLETWFDESIERHQKTKSFAAEVKSGVNVSLSVPFLCDLFTKVTNSFKYNSTYKEELRRVIKNSFSLFADAFNQLITAAEDAVAKAGKGKKILFVVDGTDRLSGEDSKAFFVDDVNQLTLINSNFIYCGPISLLHEGNQVQQFFSREILPMIKVSEKDDRAKRSDAGFAVLREMVYRRADKSLFDSEDTLDYLIGYSGGCHRELLKLLHYTFLASETESFDRQAAEKAVLSLATDYKRFLESRDYKILSVIDSTSSYDEDPQRVLFLLYNLALLEYNSYWRRSHPVICLLDEYKNAGGC